MGLEVLLIKSLIHLSRIYSWIIIANFVFAWLKAFRVDLSNPIVYGIYSFTEALVTPAVDMIRKVVPTLFGIDFSFAILLIGLSLIEGMLYTRLMDIYMSSVQ